MAVCVCGWLAGWRGGQECGEGQMEARSEEGVLKS
jgi:hypothetical protein